MPLLDYRCESCGFTDEYLIGATTGGKAPEVCPKCNGKMERQYTWEGFQFDIIGWSPDNLTGKKNWKRRLSVEDQAAVLSPDQNGKYRDPW